MLPLAGGGRQLARGQPKVVCQSVMFACFQRKAQAPLVLMNDTD